MAHDDRDNSVSAPTCVDPEHLDRVALWLTDLQGFVENQIVGEMDRIKEQLNATNVDLSDNEIKLNADATFFGGFYSAYGINAKHDAVFNSVQKSLTHLAKSLGKTADATTKIAERYKTTEERNRATMQDIDKLLADGEYRPAKKAQPGSGAGPRAE